MDKMITIIGATQEYEHIDAEIEAANTIIDDLGIDKTLFKYVKPCEDYSTIKYIDDVDLFRIKYTDNAKWIKVYMPPELKKKYMDDPLFDAEKKKTGVFWKSNINDLHDYKDIILEGIEIRNENIKKD